MRLRLKELREEQHFTQTQLAVRANKSPVTINQIETGIRNPSLKTLEELADALGVDLTDLFERVDPLKAEPPLPFAETQEETQAERRVRAFADFLEKLYSMLASQTSNLPDPPQDVTERVRVEEALKRLLDVFFAVAESLDEQAVRDAELYSTVNAIGRKMLPKVSKWLHKYGETSQLDDIDEKVKSWNQALQQGSEISR